MQTQKKNAKEQIIDGLLNDLDKSQNLAMDLIARMRQAQMRLAEIALRPNVMPPKDYIQQLIDNENRNQKPGYSGRVKALEDIKQQGDLLEKVQDPNHDFLAGYKADVHVKASVQRVKKTKGARGGVFGIFGF